MSSPTRFTLALVGLTALLAAACGPVKVNSYLERGTDLSRYHTYTWDAGNSQATGDPRLDNNTFFHDRVQAAIEQQMNAKGLEKTTSAVPDLFIHYHASVGQGVDFSEVDRTWGYSQGYCVDNNDCRPAVYEGGTLMVDLIDARTKTLVWRGWAESHVDGVIDNQKWLDEKVDADIAKIFARLTL